ncbi:MAG TPA: YIP1 family protein [Candidatus Eisenbacteria bacterium]|nr:YIP1 family protein [Candidatus Eisenbacteria bacterium]
MNVDLVESGGAPEAKGPNEFATLGSIFVNPKATFEAMAERPRFVLALVLVVLAITAMTIPIFQSGVVRDETIAKMEAKGTPEAQVEATAKFFDSPVGLAISLGGNVVGVPFALLVTAGILLFMGNLMLGAKLRFPHYLSAAVYGSTVGLIDHAVRTALIVAKQSMDVRLGLGNLFGDDLPFMGRVLDSMTDPLLLWGTAITALGVAVYAKKGFGFGAIVVLPTFIVTLLLSAMR